MPLFSNVVPVELYFFIVSCRSLKGCKTVKPIFHHDAKYLVSGVGVGQCPRRQNFALEIPTCWYILALPIVKIASPPTPNLKFALSPTPTPDPSQ